MPIGLKLLGRTPVMAQREGYAAVCERRWPRPPCPFVKPAAKRSASGHPPRARAPFATTRATVVAELYFFFQAIQSCRRHRATYSACVGFPETVRVPSVVDGLRPSCGACARVFFFCFCFLRGSFTVVVVIVVVWTEFIFALVLNVRHVCVRIRESSTNSNK